jgi:hypothetical protein
VRHEEGSKEEHGVVMLTERHGSGG